MWLNWQRENRVLIVFIHGLFGSRWSTWKSLFDSLQADVIRSHIQPSSEFNLFGFDIYSWQYRSGLWRQPRLQPKIVDEFGFWLEGITANGRYRSVILVCHSQGGIIAKSYVLESLRREETGELKVDLIITVGTPHRGPRFYINLPFSLLCLLKKIPLLAWLIPFNQFCQLASISSVLKRLKKEWNDSALARAAPAERVSLRAPIRSYAIHKKYDPFVSHGSARGFQCDDEVFRSSLPPVIQPETLRAFGLDPDRFILRGHFLKLQDLFVIEWLLAGHLPVDDILQRIRRIRASLEEFDAFLDVCIPLVVGVITAVFPGISARRLEEKTAELLNDFLELYPRFPFRGFSWPEVTAEFARQRLGVYNG